jgi:uncharacterized protein
MEFCSSRRVPALILVGCLLLAACTVPPPAPAPGSASESANVPAAQAAGTGTPPDVMTPAQAAPAALTTPQASSTAESNGGTQDLTIDLGDFQSKAVLTYPMTGTDRLPTVILIAGGGPEDMDASICVPDDSGQLAAYSHIFPEIAGALNGAGLAVLRYNKRYVTGPCQGDFAAYDAKLDMEGMLADAEKVLATAQTNDRVDPKRIFVYGWSEGSTVAAALAVHHPELAGLIVQAPVTAPWRETFAYQVDHVQVPYVRSFAPDGRVVTATIQSMFAGPGGLAAKGIGGDLLDPAAQQTGHMAVNPYFDKNKDGVIDIDAELLPNVGPYLDQMFQPGGPAGIYGPGRALPGLLELAPDLKLPVLILQGENDANVAAQGARALDAALTGTPDHTLKVYPGLGHSLGRAPSVIEDDFRPIAPEPLADLAAWLQAHSKG